MAVRKVVELQDHSGNIIHPHTEAIAVFMSDGHNLEEHMSEDITEEELRALFNHTQSAVNKS